MNQPMDITLTGVPQTLLLPLIGRAKFSQASYSPLHDKKALELVSALNYDFDHLLSVKYIKECTFFWMARAVHFDKAIRDYIVKHPDAVVVNLGAGLDTTFHRVDNGRLQWVDIDLPEVIALRKQLLSPSVREHTIEKSILDFSWMQDVKTYGKQVIIFAGGLFMYFTEAQVKSLMVQIAKEFPEGEVIFDNLSLRILTRANNMLKKSGMGDAVLQWRVKDAKTMEAWSPSIQLVSQHSYFHNIKTKYPFPFSLKWTMFYLDFAHHSGIVHLKFA